MKASESPGANRVNLYEKVAGRVAHLIDHGTLSPGARVPSVRRLSRQLQVSLSTVLQAYQLLEDQGRIEARPQSGYYVRARFPDGAAEPGISRPSRAPAQVTIGELVMMVVRDTRNPDLLPLGAAIPNPELLPIERLNRCLTAAARRHGSRGAAYDVPPGSELLRVQIARRALMAGCTLTPDEIVTTSGCQEAILLGLRALCRRGDTVAVESPVYYGTLQAIESLGLRALEIPTHPREGISLAALRDAVDANRIAACVIIPNFSNPLGSCMPDEKKKELVELLGDRGIPLIEDDIYGDLCFSAERPKVARAFDRKNLVLLCSSFSKTLAPGYRVGWIVPGRFQAEIERLKFVHTVAAATLPQLAIAEFLTSGGYDHYLRRMRRIYARQVALMAQAVSRFFPDGTRVTRPSGGFVLWIELPRSIDSLQLYELALQANISLAPGPLFSARRKYRNFIRLNAAYWSPEIEAAVATLGRLAAGLQNRTRS